MMKNGQLYSTATPLPLLLEKKKKNSTPKQKYSVCECYYLHST